MKKGRLYDDLAWLWPVLSPPEDYEEEAEVWRDAIVEMLGSGRHKILEMGVGGGHNLSHLTNDFDATAMDLSEEMLNHSRKLNPGVEHHQGDMRTINLHKQFDAVLVHDAIDYMLTEDDMRQVFQNAAKHLRKGGVLIASPDYVTENFIDSNAEQIHRKEGDLDLTFFEYVYDPNPNDNTFEVEMFFLIREKGGHPKIERDHHTMGLFSIDTWMRLLAESGFAVDARKCEGFDADRMAYMFTGVKE